MSDPVAYLREQTHLRHKTLEKRECFARIMHPAVSLDDYKALLTLLYRFYAQAEPMLNTALKTVPWQSIYRPRLDLLVADLESLDVALPAPASPQLVLSSADSLLGTLYVIEGSALGGQIIARHLGSVLRQEVSRSMAFYSTLGQDVGFHWQKIIGQMRSQLRTDDAQKMALSGANAVFDSLLELSS